ncbi:sensor histidine kinase [Indioceanicola profundi]|uniref:sensor histidine kinase n=1 Tax=Indioceanicola profundi TaxID=2220096 RepID=UPI000E6A96C6|nr:sensor histidine kinase [Indioceanicola profundi]
MAKPDLATGTARTPQQDDGLSELSRDELVERCRSLSSLLSDRERVLRELQHRAKNSLQLVISMLRLQHHRIADPVARAAYDQTMFRVEVLAILYRQIHEARSEVSVNLARYAEEICETALGNVGDLPTPVHVSVNAEPLHTSLYTAMPLGLIINELVMSGLRHAYPAEGRMEVILEEEKDGVARLTVTGNGRALPPGFDTDADNSAMLVEALATQLGADLDIRGGAGTTSTLTLKL